jgi:hypothetical protein
MAIELLVRAVTNRPRPGQSFRSFWEQGEVVDVKELPHGGWGRLADPSQGATDFWVIELPIDLDSVRVADLAQDGTVSRRRYRLNVAGFPAGVRDSLRSTGRAVFTSGELVQLDGSIVERMEERTDNNEIEP